MGLTMATHIIIPAKYVLALKLFSGTFGLRMTINSICIAGNLAVSTDGARLAMYRLDDGVSVPESVIPTHAFDIVKEKAGDVSIHLDGEGGVTVKQRQIYCESALIKQKYPDFKRVIPNEVSGKVAQFQGKYLADIHKAMSLINRKSSAEISHNGDGPAIVDFYNSRFFVVMMPISTIGPMASPPEWASQKITDTGDEKK